MDSKKDKEGSTKTKETMETNKQKDRRDTEETLKTLKDLGIGCRYCIGTDYNNMNELKKEAIKWVKFRTNPDTQQFIMTFFNLTEEDLKEKTE